MQKFEVNAKPVIITSNHQKRTMVTKNGSSIIRVNVMPGQRYKLPSLFQLLQSLKFFGGHEPKLKSFSSENYNLSSAMSKLIQT